MAIQKMTREEAVSFAMKIAKEKKAEVATEVPRRSVTSKEMIELRNGCFREAVAELYGGGSRYAERLED